MHHAILGPGGVGGLIGAVLARAGDEVTLIVRPSVVEYYPRQLSLKSRAGDFSVQVSVSAALAQPVDVLWITVKATDLTLSLKSIPISGQVGIIVPLLNGIDHIALLRGRFGLDKVVPATIAVETERIAPGEIVQRSPFARLRLSSRGRTALASAAEKFQGFGFECSFTDDEITLMWSKLVFLAPFALSTSAINQSIGEVISDASHMAQLTALVAEACDVARAEGAKVNQGTVMDMFKTTPAEMRSSMQRDVERGKVPELDAIAGPILRGAKAHGIHAPTTQQLVGEIQDRFRANQPDSELVDIRG